MVKRTSRAYANTIAIASCLSGFLLAATSAFATDWDECRSQNFQLRVKSCSAIIDSGKEKNEGLVEAYAMRAIAFDILDQFDKSLADFDRAIALDPKNAFVYHSRGLAFAFRNDHDHAIADFSSAIEANPSYPETYLDRGNSFSMALGKFELAIADNDKAIALRPNYPMAFSNRGISYISKRSASGKRSLLADLNELNLDPTMPMPSTTGASSIWRSRNSIRRWRTLTQPFTLIEGHQFTRPQRQGNGIFEYGQV